MKKYKVGYVAGIFDVLHIGHIDTLRRAKEQCEYLIVAVGTDEFLKIRKNRDAVIPYVDRVQIIQSLKYVDEVVPEHDLDKIRAYKEYKFDVMFAGDDHQNEQVYIDAEKILNELGVDVIYLPHIHKVSSTWIREKIRGMDK